MSVDKTLKALGLRKKTPADKVREAGKNLNARFAKLRGATPESRARVAGDAAFARKRNVRRGLWRQPNVAALAKQLALNDYKTPAARRATQS